MQTKTAQFIRTLYGFTGNAALYRMTPPHDGHEYVVVSATRVMFSGPETYIFPATSDGKVSDWCELDGSYRGSMSHESALANAGYTLALAEVR